MKISPLSSRTYFLVRSGLVVGPCLLALSAGAQAQPAATPAAAPAAATTAPVTRAAPKTIYKFDFGSGDAAPGYTKVTPDMGFDAKRGFGFEPGAKVSAVGKDSGKTVEGDAITSEQPFYFTANVPEEGNYRVTVTLGNPELSSNNTVKAELRRLMAEKVVTEPGKFTTRTFLVNTRLPQYPGGTVRLKAPRETTGEAWAWDDKIELEFNGDHPSVAGIVIEKVDVPTLYILGDSTVCDQSGEGFNSWGQMLTRWFKPEIALANHAESGETIASSFGEKRFDKVFSIIKPGDYLIFQFAHNDMKSNAPNALATYKVDVKRAIDETRKRGAFPIVVGAMERSNGVTTDTLKGYPAAALEVAQAEGVPGIDLHSMSQKFYQALGPDVKLAFQDGVTHHNNYGSYELSKCIVLGIKGDKIDLAKYIVDDFPADFDPGKPDAMATFAMTPSPRHATARPLGDESTFGPAGADNAAAPAAAPAPAAGK